MAAIVTGAIGEVASLLESGGIAGLLAKGATIALGSVAATELIKAIQSDLAGGGTAAATARKLAPQYALVDLHNNVVVKTLSRHRTYVILTHRSRRSRARGPIRERVIEVPVRG